MKIKLHGNRGYRFTSATVRKLAVASLPLTAFLAFAISAQADVNLVTNGNFEDTTLTASGQINSSGDVTGWSSPYDPTFYNFLYFPGQAVQPAVGAVDTDGSNAYVWLYGPNGGPTGGNFVAADADPSYSGAISQTINGLTVGQSYDLSFDWAGAQYTTKTGSTTESWLVSLGSETQSTGYINTASQSYTPWQQANMVFTATSSTEVLSFLALGTPAGGPPVSLLDNVSLVAPEPAFFIPGLGLMVFMAIAVLRSRKRAKV